MPRNSPLNLRLPWPREKIPCWHTRCQRVCDGGSSMKKLLAILVSVIVLSMTALPAAAQTRCRRTNAQTTYSRYDTRYDRNTGYDSRYGGSVYRNDQTVYQDYYGYNNRSVWQRHRDKLTTA